MADGVTRLSALEERLTGAALPDREVLEGSVSSLVKPLADFNGTEAYKRYLAGVVVADTVLRAQEEEAEVLS